MIKGELPTWKEKKQLLYDREIEVDPAYLAEIGTRLEKAGRFTDALEFFHRAGRSDGMDRLRAGAIERGDFFLYKRCRDLAGLGPDAAEAGRLAASAMARGTFSYAMRACAAIGDKAGEQAARDRLREVLPDAGIIFETDEKEEEK